jgi:hypothetical protein
LYVVFVAALRAEVVPVQLPPSKAEPSGRLLEQDESLAKVNTQKLRGLKPFFKQVRCNTAAAAIEMAVAAWFALCQKRQSA